LGTLFLCVFSVLSVQLIVSPPASVKTARARRETRAWTSGDDGLLRELDVEKDELQEYPVDAVVQRQAEYVICGLGK
jgi:hypothetical protein